jgi:hypothetical protein
MLRAACVQLMSLVGGCLLLAGVASAMAPLPPVAVYVNQSNIAGAVKYQYWVVNNSPFPVTSIVIGLNYFSGLSEIQTPPAGWSVDGGLPASSSSSPNGWTAKVIPTEDTSLLQFEWDASTPSAAIAPGQTLQGFSIILLQPDVTYSSSDWTVYVNGAGTNYYTGPLVLHAVPCDYPRLAISLAPDVLWPPNHKLVTINASISALDDNYPNPQVRLGSITANEPLKTGDIVADFGTRAQTFKVISERKGNSKAGRVYTVTYSATNSCGNSTSASETIVVPHDQGN